jgi:DNA topoisomerase VI subunit B
MLLNKQFNPLYPLSDFKFSRFSKVSLEFSILIMRFTSRLVQSLIKSSSARPLVNCGRNFRIPSFCTPRFYSTVEDVEAKNVEPNAEAAVPKEEDSLIPESETFAKDALKKHSFKAETKRILDLMAKSLYSEKEVFIRELISNCSDALEKRHYYNLTNESDKEYEPLEIRISVDKDKRTFTIQDTGIGMNEEELNDNLGTIAKSGSLKFSEEKGNKADKIIGQFGVGFYSALMVGDEIRVYSRSAKPDSKGYVWKTNG